MDLSSIKHLIMHNLTINKLIPSFRSQFDHHDEWLRHTHYSPPWDPRRLRGVQMMRMLYLLTMMVESTSVTCPRVVVMLVQCV